jgi:hypothetical protein
MQRVPALIRPLVWLSNHPLALLFGIAAFSSFFDVFRLHYSIYKIGLGPITLLSMQASKVVFALIVGTCLVTLYRMKPLRIPLHVQIFGVVIFYAMITGIVQMFAGTQFIDFSAYSSHVFSFGGIFIALWAGSVLNPHPDEDAAKKMDFMAKAAVIVHVLVILLAFFLRVPQGVSLLAAAAVGCWLLVRNQPIWFLIEAGAVLLSGKRSILLAFILAVILVAVFSIRHRPKISSMVGIGLAAVIGLIALGLSQYRAGAFTGNLAFERPLGRINYMIENLETGDASKASAGRSDELEITWSIFGSDPVRLMTGSGMGWWYPFYGVTDADGETFRRHYTHFSPAVFFYTFGVLGVILLTFFVWRTGTLINGQLGDELVKNPIFFVVAVYIVARFFEGLFGSTWHTDSMNWYLVGFLSANALAKRRAALKLKEAPQPPFEPVR